MVACVPWYKAIYPPIRKEEEIRSGKFLQGALQATSGTLEWESVREEFHR